MKKKWFSLNPLFRTIASTGRFKILMFLIVILAIFAAFNFNQYDRNLYSGIIFCHTQITFILLFHFIILLATLNTCITFYQYDNYLIRLENKKNVIKKLSVLVLQVNLYLILLFLVIYLSLYNLVMLDCNNVKEVFHYGIKNDVYAIYTMLKFYFLAILYMIINTALFVIAKEGKTTIINTIYLLSFFLIMPPEKGKFSIFPWNYYYMLDYQSFKKEIFCFFLFSVIIIIIILLLIKIGTRQKRRENYEN